MYWLWASETVQPIPQRNSSDTLRRSTSLTEVASKSSDNPLHPNQTSKANKLQLPRICLGAPLDLIITRQKNAVKFILDRYLPSLSRWVFDTMIEQYSKKSFTFDPSWRLSPAPSLANHQPVISDNLVSSLAAGDITSVHGLKRFISAKKVELLDGTILEVDAVVLCTGYEPDFSHTPDFSPLEAGDNKKAGINNVPLARLYQNVFPPQYATSLAYTNYVALTEGAITYNDIIAMAIAQVFKGACTLPSAAVMDVEISKHHAWVRSLGQNDSVYTGIIRPGPWFRFMNAAAGTGVDENLGYGLEGWKFWMRERKLCNLMMSGVMTPFMYRVFEGRRKKWDGAREAILHANELASVYKR